MVSVPAGSFEMGSDGSIGIAECRQLYGGACLPGDYTDEEPSHIITLDDFYIDTYEVSNAQYKACVNAGVCDPPIIRGSDTRSSYYGDPQYDNFPVIYVKWTDAVAFCQWRGARLPTEAEWEKAARGTEALTYPWGNSFVDGISNFCDRNCREEWRNMNYDDGYADTSPVGTYPGGASPYGAMDLAGNVWEWVADWYAEDYYANSPTGNPTGPSLGTDRVIRGGAWNVNGSILRTTTRTAENPNDGYYNIGFRCARSP
jgi:formylglycine-generating enzyme required for sulfatase activity